LPLSPPDVEQLKFPDCFLGDIDPDACSKHTLHDIDWSTPNGFDPEMRLCQCRKCKALLFVAPKR
jgi:hypothetical protein